MTINILSIGIRFEHDVVLARQRARQLAASLGFDGQDQVRIATTVSEIARNAFVYGGGGKVDFQIEGKTAPQIFQISVIDSGPGIKDLKSILSGQYKSRTGMGVGLIGAKRLMDQFEIDSAPGRGTTVQLRKLLPERAALVTQARVNQICGDLAAQRPQNPVEEVQQQNRELLRALEELRRRQDELSRLNSELEDTNRGVVALYAELAERADSLRQADELKTRFLSDMSHEFRTPLNSSLALAGLLLGRADGDLSPEQEKQIGFIRRNAETLLNLVNDLLDMAKIEAGKTVVRVSEFRVSNVFSAMRGVLKPLLLSESVALTFEVTHDVPAMRTDEGKVSQILRNLISNALKFTEQGSIHVTAAWIAEENCVDFKVADTGMGIAPENLEMIFQEFGQVEHDLQKHLQGTGLGLPLSRKLARLLGGDLTVESHLGSGSVFTARIPLCFNEMSAGAVTETETGMESNPADSQKIPVLFVEDDAETIFIYEKYINNSNFQPIIARTVRQAQAALKTHRPRAIILDVTLGGETTWHLLANIRASEETAHIPIIVASTVDDEAKGLALGASAYVVKPLQQEWLLETLDALTQTAEQA